MGVAGGYCSGKDTLVSYLVSLGFRSIDVDRVGHEQLALPEVRRQVRAAFGEGVLDRQGRVDRRALGRVVFARRRSLRRLEAILHPRMAGEVEGRLAEERGPTVINAAVLFRMGLHELCRAAVCVRAPLVRRFRWARRRDGVGLARFLRILCSQRGICPKVRRPGVDTYYVANRKGPEHLREQALGVLRALGVEDVHGKE